MISNNPEPIMSLSVINTFFYLEFNLDLEQRRIYSIITG